MLQEGWKSIDVLRIGYSLEGDSSTPVTISITVDWTLDCYHWHIAEQQIKTVFRNERLKGVEVDFERGDVDPGAFPLSKPSRRPEGPQEYYKGDYPLRAPMGVDFGPKNSFRASPNGRIFNGPHATIGGYLEFRQKGGVFKKYAVTNYHCIREAIDGYSFKEGPDGKAVVAPVRNPSELYLADDTGLGPKRRGRETIRFESPSRRKHYFSLQYHDEQIEKWIKQLEQNPDTQDAQEALSHHRASRSRKLEYFDQGKHQLGHLFMYSGFRPRIMNHRIDIALIEVNADKMGDNTVPRRESWKASFRPPESTCGKLLSGIKPCFSGNAPPEAVFKIGARTVATTGRFSHIRTDIKLSWDKRTGLGYSEKYCFVADPETLERPLFQHGVSGSFVFSEQGEWVGLALGGAEKINVVGRAL
ncbi:MAG: hypothetical protein Q9181_005045 [Wetmoreana brouardii]